MTSINESALRVGDAVCIASKSLLCSSIRFMTARLKGYNPFVEAFRLKIANHVGIIILVNERPAIAEMLGTGLEINPVADYLKDPKEELIVGVRRLPVFDSLLNQAELNDWITAVWNADTIEYATEKLFKYFGIDSNNPKHLYCSELVELCANRFNATFDNWQLKRSGVKRRIAPVEIQYGLNTQLVNIN